MKSKRLRSFQNKLLLAGIAFFLINFFFATDGFGFCSKNNQVEKGKNGKINRKELEAKLKSCVDGYIINGTDLINIIKTTGITINIKNSIIKGGVYFPIVRSNVSMESPPEFLPSIPLDGLSKKELGFWEDHEIANLKSKLRSKDIQKVYLISNSMNITDSVIKPSLRNDGSQGYSVKVDTVGLLFKNMNFKNTRFAGKVKFSGAFTRAAVFTNATFEQEATFGKIFMKKAGFRNATFKGKATFRNTLFKDKADFGSGKFVNENKEATFNEAVFEKGVDFRKAKFLGKADFMYAQFKNKEGNTLSFSQSNFEKNADFRGAKFHVKPIFDGTNFNGTVEFLGASFDEDVEFSDVTFHGKSDFSSLEFKGDANFEKTKFKNSVNFKGATFEKKVDFKNSTFEGEPKFGSIKFIGEAKFGDTIFEGPVDFKNATFKEEADFSGSLSCRGITFENTIFVMGSSLYLTNYFFRF